MFDSADIRRATRRVCSVALFAGAGLVLGSFFNVSHARAADYNRFSGQNSQTIALLAAPISVRDPRLALGGGDIVIEDGALAPETGPLGTRPDIAPVEDGGHISVYVVREGDTLSQIAGMFEVSVNTIRWANDIASDTGIHDGDTLIILPITGIRHTVAAGDTLESVVKKYGGDLAEVRAYNDLLADATLAVGDTVIIPGGEVARSKTKPAATPRGAASAAPEYAGYYLRPVRGGYRSQGIHGYNGVDLATYAGAEIYAAAAGSVIVSRNSGYNGGYGSYVVVRHDNGTQTLYAHMSAVAASVGQYVAQGQVIGYVGSTGRSTGSHLHFEVRGAKNPF